MCLETCGLISSHSVVTAVPNIASPGPSPLPMRPEVGEAFIENSKNANNTHIGPGVLHLGGVLH